MARKKVTIKYIPHEKTRRETLKKRSNNLTKKAGEVATMCNAKACVIVYPEGNSAPQVFLSHEGAVGMLHRFRSMTNDDPFNRKMDQECFLKKRIGKIEREELRSGRKCEENEIRLLLHKAMMVGHVGLSMEELTNVDCNLEVLLKGISDRITNIHGQPPVYLPSQAQVQTTNFTSGMDIIQDLTKYHAQAPTPSVTGSMDAIGASMMYKAHALTPYVTGVMDTVAAPPVYQDQAPTPYVTGGMDTIGAPTVYQAQAPPHQQEEWLELMRSGGGDLGMPICSGLNDDSSLNSTADLNGNDVMQPFDLGSWFNAPWGGADPCPSSRDFPPM